MSQNSNFTPMGVTGEWLTGAIRSQGDSIRDLLTDISDADWTAIRDGKKRIEGDSRSGLVIVTDTGAANHA